MVLRKHIAVCRAYMRYDTLLMEYQCVVGVQCHYLPFMARNTDCFFVDDVFVSTDPRVSTQER